MNYRSICTGIAAETVAWHPLGWRALSFAEIDPFCNSLLKARFPEVRNVGDFTKTEYVHQCNGEPASTDILFGGTPCQSFSNAGNRKGLDDARGNLALQFIELAKRLRVRWVVWENVAGVLSRDGGRAFGIFLGALVEGGYGVSYRVLDAQYDGLAQRRKRVFVVGYLGDWRPSVAVLFERESLRRDTSPRRTKGKETTEEPGSGVEVFGGGNSSAIDVATTLSAKGGSGRSDFESESFVSLSPPLRANGPGGNRVGDSRGQDAVVTYFNCDARVKVDQDVARVLKSDTGSGGRGCVMQAVPILEAGARTGKSTTDIRCGSGIGEDGDPMYTLTASKQHAVMAFHGAQITSPANRAQPSEILAPKLNQDPRLMLAEEGSLRRMTPREWERLMGFPDNFTLIEYRGKPAADGPRYKAIGNSVAVPTLKWLATRIQMVEDIMAAQSCYSSSHGHKDQESETVPDFDRLRP